MATQTRNVPKDIAVALSAFSEHWFRRLARVNDYDIKIAKLKGAFVWHSHNETNEFFMVLSGTLIIRMKAEDGGDVTLEDNQVFVVPKGLQHCPETVDEEDVTVMIIEPKGVINTGDGGKGERTREVVDVNIALGLPSAFSQPTIRRRSSTYISNTVTLVRKRSQSPPLPQLPAFGFEHDHGTFTSVSLTPQPDPSVMSRLPTPDYPHQADSSSSSSEESSLPLAPEDEDPNLHSRATSVTLFTYFKSRSNRSSVKTLDKFTQKWPKPLSFRRLDRKTPHRNKGTGLVGTAVEVALEEGQGMGLEPMGKWTISKWILLLSVVTVFAYGCVGLACALSTWFKTWPQADVLLITDPDVVILIALASSLLLFSSLVGLFGTLLNSRHVLAVYALLLWPSFISMLAIGYTAYKRATFSLDKKINLAWSEYFTSLGRLTIQYSLQCCGYYTAIHEAVPSGQCYARASLPGCKGPLLRFEETNLQTIWTTAFVLVPLHIANIFSSLLCSNHVTKTFGMGITPKMYRLSGVDVRADAEKIWEKRMQADRVARPFTAKRGIGGHERRPLLAGR